MTVQNPQPRNAWLSACVRAVQRSALVIVLFAAVSGAGMVWYTMNHLSVDTDSGNLISAKLPWRQAESRLDHAFPQLSDQLIVVIDGDTPELAAKAEQELVNKLSGRPKLFSSVFAPELDPYFRHEGFLFLSPKELNNLGNQLSKAQPFLGTLSQNPSVDGLASLLSNAVDHSAASASFDMTPAFDAIAKSVAATTSGQFAPLSWQALMQQGAGESLQSDPNRRFIDLAPVFDYSRALPAGKPIAAVRDAIKELHLDKAHGVSVRLTGDVAMSQDELQTATEGATLALSAAMVMVTVLLFIALRSVRLVIVALVTLVYGLLMTAAFAAWTIGHLNMISIAFGVLYVGLGIDYALYLCMQYRERIGEGFASRDALPLSAGDVGGFMAVCAATTSLGFFAFIPTNFTGIAELGIISGAGMFISLLLSLTLLPALITVMPPNAEHIRLTPAKEGWVARVATWPYRYARPLWIAAALAAVASIVIAPRLSFDFNPLDLRDPHSEAVSTFKQLLKDPNIPTLTLSIIEPDEKAAKAMADKLAKLPLVKQTVTLDSFVPEDQQQKLAMIQDLSFTLGPSLGTGHVSIKVNPDDVQSLRALEKSLAGYHGPDVKQDEAAVKLRTALQQFLAKYEKADASQRSQLMARLRSNLLSGLPDQLASLSDALNAQAVTRADIPHSLSSRWVDAEGGWRVEVWPKHALVNNAETSAFVDQVRAVAPQATGAPVVMIESARTMVHAYQQAFTYSLIAIGILLLVLLRSVVDVLLVLIPLALAGLFTLAALVVFNVPLNFANIIALPLILGVGVDYGVYIVQRGRVAARVGVNILQTSTARAVAFGGLITMANFGNLMLAKYPGMVSMGMLLTIGLAMTLLCALVLLPSLIARRYGAPGSGV